MLFIAAKIGYKICHTFKSRFRGSDITSCYINTNEFPGELLCENVISSHHSRSQRPSSFWSAPRITISGQVQHRKSAIHGLPVNLRKLRVKSDKADWFWSQSIVFTNPFKTGMSLDLARGRDSWCRPKGVRPLGTRMSSHTN